jgi:transcriptional regulator with XRE-family HTH domain
MIEGSTPPAPSDPEPDPAGAGRRTFGAWLGAQLRARRISQRQLAQRSGVDHSTISRLVRGDRVPSWSTANRLVRSLGFTDVPDGIYRLDPNRVESPPARVEYALRLDDTLGESQVRDIMNVYLATRRRRLRLVATPGPPATAGPPTPDLVRIAGVGRRASSDGRPTAAPGEPSS